MGNMIVCKKYCRLHCGPTSNSGDQSFMALSSSRWGISVCSKVGDDLTCTVIEEERSKDNLKGAKKAGLLLFSLNCQHSSWLLSSKLCHSRVRISCLCFLFRPCLWALDALFHSYLCFPHPLFPALHASPNYSPCLFPCLPPTLPFLTCLICHLWFCVRSSYWQAQFRSYYNINP